MRTIVALVLAAAPAAAATPKFVVENKCPQSFMVTNKCEGKTLCGCASTGSCSCWAGQCACPACVPTAKPAKLQNASHTCPNCGAYQNVVSREGSGEHSHKCGSCGTEWWHANPGSAQAYTLPGAGGCEGGNCPSPSASRRGLIFRR